MPSEREFIQSLQQQFPTRAPVLTGIGDDGAVLDVSQHDRQVVVTDMLLDGVHFDLQHTSPALVGRKAIAVNLSDLAAMACSPSAAFVSIALPDMFAKSDQFCDELYEGMQQIADEYGLVVAGGDTNVWDGPFAINVCLTGIPFGSSAVLRSGARPGDLLFVTGPLGGSLQSGRHLTFEPRLEQSRYLVESLQVNAMMDISDGLAIDLHRMAEASGCGAVLQHEKIPVHADVCDSLQLGERIERALSDGEDFELLLAVAANDRSRCDAAVAERGLIEIGQMTDTAGEVILRLQDGGSVPLQATGWQHLQGPGP